MYDLIIRNALVYDGSGSPPFAGDLALRGDRLADVGPHIGGPGRADLDADGLAAAPGFINMLSWANTSLLVDGRSQSDLRQGVTLEVLGEGVSMGPLTGAMTREMTEGQGDLRYAVTWRTLGGYLDHLAARGVSCNVASFVGATTARVYVLGYAHRRPTAAELDRMQALVREAMAEGAMGVSSALIYPPATCSDTAELIALAAGAAEAGGLYISHLRNEEARIDEALDEFFTVVGEAAARGEIYHLKVSGRGNWHRMAGVLERIEAERARGVEVTADVYPYTASCTGLDTAIPPWAHEGGEAALLARLQSPAIRKRLRQEMALVTDPADVLVVGFKQPRLKPLAGRTLADVASERRTGWQDAVMDLIVENGGDVGAVFFTMAEDNVRAVLSRPWVSFCSDAGSYAAEGIFLTIGTHPRAYGAFARVLGKYVREERLLTLEEAVRRLTSLPASVLRLTDRGRLAPGYFADLVLFDPATIADRATYEQPHQYATGVRHVFVNGVPVIRDGEHTGATPGRVVRGPGWRGC